MPNLKEVRSRISSTISTQQITKAMKLVSATKLRKAQAGIVQMRPYSDKLNGILRNLSESVDNEKLAKYFHESDPEKVLLVIVTSDRGLCGGFNANVIKRAKALIESDYAEAAKKKQVELLFIGKKGYEALKKYNYKSHTNFMNAFTNLNADSVFEIGDFILEKYLSGEYNHVDVIYNKFKNAATQIVSNDLLLPVTFSVSKKDKSKHDFIFEPDKQLILERLIPRAVKTQLYRNLMDSFASEHGARMIAMDKATDNAGEILRQLKLQYNRARQAAITNEISEIVGGAAALNG